MLTSSARFLFSQVVPKIDPDRQERYEVKFGRLMEALEHDRLDFEGTQSRLLRLLEPLPFDADIAQHLDRFIGRKWVFQRIEDWLDKPDASGVFWITGKPGVGKTAVSAWLCYHHRGIAAFHLCRDGHNQKADCQKYNVNVRDQRGDEKVPDTVLLAMKKDHRHGIFQY